MWLTDVSQAVCGIGTDGLDMWPDNKTIDGFFFFVLKTLFSLTGEVQSANICLKISNRDE